MTLIVEALSGPYHDHSFQGWTLLAEGCPDCGVPLLRKAPAPETYCVNCEGRFLSGQRVSPNGDSGGSGGVGGAAQLQQPPASRDQDMHAPAESDSSDGEAMDAADDPTADARL